jgi:two-component system CheB/CheR fusion protein
VVGIGASAGGVQVLQELFGEMPNDTGLAFVVIMHLAPEYESNLAEILQQRTKMPVVQVTERVQVTPNQVYVIPPNKHLTMSDSMLVLSEPQKTQGRRVTIDLFFRTLAEQYGQRALCIVLSGSDSDGAIGLKHIKAQGGVTIAQDPNESEHDVMPRSAIETGMVDWVLPVKQMVPRLLEYMHNERRMKLPPEEDGDGEATSLPDLAPRGIGGPLVSKISESEADENALHQVLMFLRMQTGHDFSHYKRATLLRRIARRLQVNSLDDVPAYLSFMHTHPGEARALLHDLLIGVTHFFRDQAAFAMLEAHVPQLFSGKSSGDQLRVWVPGCATGEEAYSLAMLLAEQSLKINQPPMIQIFATDLDEDSIRIAREGIYPATIEADVSQERLRRFFFNYHGRYRIKKEIRELVLFADHDLLRDSPFSKLDLISCRNLLIYLKPEAQHRVMDIFHFALRPGGLLMLGGSEHLDDNHPFFGVVDKRHRIYMRRSTSRLPMVNLLAPTPRWRKPIVDVELPRFANPMVAAEFTPPKVAPELSQAQRRGRSLGDLHVALLDQYGPPSVVVDENYDILHMSAKAAAYLRFAAGEPSANLLKLVDESLRTELRSALFRASQERARVSDKELRYVDIDVRPAQTQDSGGQVFLVVFDEKAATAEEKAAPAPPPVEGGVAQHLEDELQHLRQQFNVSVEQSEASNEELKASNEELQSMNEELRSATEELGTGKEELQSINEELTTVNHELKSNVEELSRANSDLQNLMSATDLGIIFLDRDLRIKRFTPRVQELFNVLPTDIDRPLSDLTARVKYPELPNDAFEVLRTLERCEREVQADGHWFLVRLGPYRTVEDKIDGVVVSFIDITPLKTAESQLRENMQELQRFNRVAVGRESRMIELKKEINNLRGQLGQTARYALEFEKDEESSGS